MRIIEVKENVKIVQKDHDVILEKGDRVRVLENIQKISKRNFIDLHSSNSMGLVSGYIRHSAEEVFKIIERAGAENVERWEVLPLRGRSGRPNVDSQLGTGTRISIFAKEIFGKTWVVVETEADSSKNPGVSWDTIDYYSIVYVILD